MLTYVHRATYPLSILGWRNFALVWSSSTSVAMGTQMEAVVLGWLVLTLTGSPFLVGLISAARMALNFLALFSGAIVDRLPRHRVLAAVEFTMTALGILMIGLIVSGLLEVWHIFAITVTASMVRIFQMPSAQSLVADTLPKDRIGNGAAFTTLGMNFAMIVGPLIGGILFPNLRNVGMLVIIAFTGMAFASTQVFMLTLLLRTIEPEFRGRVMGLRVLAIYAFSFGSVTSGAMAGLWGAPWQANIVGSAGIALVLILFMLTPKLRQA